MTPHPILSYLDMIYVINLPSRTDRRAEMAEQLSRTGLGFDDPHVTLFPAMRPPDRGDFPSVGARGCFLSHLAVLKDARERQFRRVLLLEDDADFARPFRTAGEADIRRLGQEDWDIFYFGYRTMDVLAPAPGSPRSYADAPASARLDLSHAVMFRNAAVGRLIPYLEGLLERRAGDPRGGPMHVDGAYNWFRRQNPDIRTVVTSKQWIVQRSSRTDIAELGWKDRIGVVGPLRRLRNRWH